MRNVKVQSYTLSDESIAKLNQLTKEFGMNRSQIIDRLIKAAMSPDAAEALFTKTLVKLVMLQKTLEK